MGSRRLAGALLVFIGILVSVAVLATMGVPPCTPVAPIFVAGLLASLSPLVLLPFLGRMCRVSVDVKGDVLMIRLGRCGHVEIPLGLLSSVSVVNSISPTLRLMGTALPGFYYSGLFEVGGVGRAYIFSERLENLVELRLSTGDTVYVGGDSLERVGELLRASRSKAGGVVAGSFRVMARSGGWIDRLVAVIIAMYFAALPLVYGVLPERAPVHFTLGWRPDRWGSRMEVMAVYLFFGAIAVFLAAVRRVALKRDPVAGLILALFVPGLLLLGLAVTLISSTLCPWQP